MPENKPDRRGLGRGLSALMADVQVDAEPDIKSAGSSQTLTLPIEQIAPNPDQPRKSFPEGELAKLAKSIEEKGIIQPLIVRKNNNKSDSYQIVAGERRWRAAQMAQLHELPVIVREFSDQEVLEIAIIENIQRENLNPIDEAVGYQHLVDQFGHTQEELSKALSVSRSHIANTLRLLTLPKGLQKYLVSGEITAGHARAALAADDPEALVKAVLAKGLSVREAERLAKLGSTAKVAPKPTQPVHKDADTIALEKELSSNLKLRLSIDHNLPGESGKVTIHYKDMMDLDRICGLLSAHYPDDSR